MAPPPRSDEASPTWIPWLGCAAVGGLLGAATMALLDPDCGPQRRQAARTAARHLWRRLRRQRAAPALCGPLCGHAGPCPSGPSRDANKTCASDNRDEEARILARVRSQLGRLCEDAQAVEVRLHAGVLELHGQVRRLEQRRVVAGVRRIYGVDEVRNFLHTYERHAYLDDGHVVH